MTSDRRKPPCLFWVFLPCVVLLIASLALSFEYMPDIGKVVSLGVGAAGILLLLAAYDAARFNWAIRSLGAAVFLAYSAYLISEIRAGHEFRLAESRSRPSPRNALLGLLTFGVPGLLIAIQPRSRPSETLDLAEDGRDPGNPSSKGSADADAD